MPLKLVSSLGPAMAQASEAVAEELDRLIPVSEDPEARLVEAMRYGTLNGGKRLRPFLVLCTAELFSVARESALRTAAAVEMVHSYSLIHDDLPAMDDDDLRRGKPTVHVAYDEATAILAGDALLTKAFRVLSSPATHPDPAVRCELISELSYAAGDDGMVGGQMLDLLSNQSEMDQAGLTRMHAMKTGRIIGFSCIAGPILGKAPARLRHACALFAHDLGLAFQIADDLLDVEGKKEKTGKTPGRDLALGKKTFVSLLGVERARAQARMLADQAIVHLDPFGEKADLLREVARFAVERET